MKLYNRCEQGNIVVIHHHHHHLLLLLLLLSNSSSNPHSIPPPYSPSPSFFLLRKKNTQKLSPDFPQLPFPAHLQAPLTKFCPKKRPTIACMAVFTSWRTFLSLSFAKSLFYTLFSFFTVKQPCQFHGFFAIALRDSIFLFLFSFLFFLFLSYSLVSLFILPILVSRFSIQPPKSSGVLSLLLVLSLVVVRYRLFLPCFPLSVRFSLASCVFYHPAFQKSLKTAVLHFVVFLLPRSWLGPSGNPSLQMTVTTRKQVQANPVKC